MALPIVNQNTDERVSKEDADRINKSLTDRFKSLGVPSFLITKLSIKQNRNKTVEKEDSTVNVLESLYRFVVQDTFEKSKNLKVEEKRTDNLEEENVELITAVAQTEEIPEQEKEEENKEGDK